MSFGRFVLPVAAALMLAPASAIGQHAQPRRFVLAEAAAPDTRHAPATGQPSISRHAVVGAAIGAIGGVLVLVGLERAYGGAPIVIVVACIGGGASIGAVGGLAVYGIRRLARRG